MTLRRLSILQWFGFLGGGAVWWASFLVGAGTTVAVCNPASGRWGIPQDTVQIGLMATALVLVGAAQVAAVVVFRATRGAEEHSPPPEGRMHFFSIAAMFGNTIFFGVILLSELATVIDRACHQS